MEELTGTVLETTFRNDENGYTVLRLSAGRGQLTVVGAMPELSAGECVAFDGDWTEHPVYGRQFSAKACRITPPESTSAIEKYLGSGLIRGIGPATAKLIVKKFGAETMNILDEHPSRLVEIPGIGPKKADMIIESYIQQMSMRRALVYLQNYGISPYRLVTDIDGVGFLTADRIALSMGIDPRSEFRLRSALYYLLNEAAGSGGHTYLPRPMLLERACQMLRVEPELVEQQITQALLMKILMAFSLPEEESCLCLPFYFHAEKEIATRLHDLMEGRPYKKVGGLPGRIEALERKMNVRFSDMQKKAIRSAVEEGVIIITGGPGTGKTTIIRCIIELLKEENDILLCAPTGRAAKRMSEATGCPAKTIHRLLEFSGDEEMFQRNQDNPLSCACLIVDEVSMVDIFLMRNLLRALKGGTRLILVGDADQLPSVGAGNVLRDILDSGALPSVRLTDIFRQEGESLIVVNAHRINHGEMPILNRSDSDFFFDRRPYAEEVARTVVALCTARLPAYLKIKDSARYIQVLAPTKKGSCGVYQLNKMLQDALNPKMPGKREVVFGEITFRMGDKVMHIKNNYRLEWETDEGEEGEGVFNGDVGFIEDVDTEEHVVTVRYDDRTVQYEYGQLEELELAYCLSVHKSQGSEFSAVVLPVVGGPKMLLTRNLFYTALTRARKLVVLVGREDAIRDMVENDHIATRYTALKTRIEEALRPAPPQIL